MPAPGAVTLDIAPALRFAIINGDVASSLAVWQGEPAVFTRRPVPQDGPYPMAVIGPPISGGDADFLTTRLPVIRRDVMVYGQQTAADSGAGDYRVVDAVAFALRQQFHRRPASLILTPAYSVVEIVVTGPMAAPTDDQMIVGRMIGLRLKLRDLST